MFDSFWHAVVTMTSVGYGDLAPVTYGGRLVSISASFVGIVILALLVNVMTDNTTFKARERKAFDLIQRGQFRTKTTKLAALLLQHCWLAHKYNRAGEKANAVKFKKQYVERARERSERVHVSGASTKRRRQPKPKTDADN
jgi:hypothetical protein